MKFGPDIVHSEQKNTSTDSVGKNNKKNNKNINLFRIKIRKGKYCFCLGLKET